MSEPGWSPQHMPGGSGDADRGRLQSVGLGEDEVLWKGLAMASCAVAVLVAWLLFPDAYPMPVMAKGAILGTGTGLMAVGLVLTYRTTRIINFAYGAMGGFAGSVAIGLNQGSGVHWFLAVPLGVAMGVVIGALVERVIIRRFVKAPRLVLTVATIGLAQLLGGAALFVPSWFDLAPVLPGFSTPLSDFEITTDQMVFDGNDWLLLAVVPLVLGGLTWFLRMTEAGIAVRGMAENMDRARLLGIPVNQLSLLLWSIAGGLASLTVMLQAPNSGIPFDAAAGPTLLLPALAAAVVARMSSLSVAFVAGVALGVIDQLIRWNFADQRELTYVVFLAVIVVALLLQRRSSSRADLADESSWTSVGVTTKLPRHLARLPEVRGAKVLLGALVAGALVYIPWQGSGAQVLYATITLAMALAALSLVVLTGWGGVVSLGQFALVGVGGLAAANLIADRNTDLFLTIGASGVAGGVLAFAIGVPALRVVGQYLAVTTLAFAVVMEQYVVKPAIHPELFPDDLQRPQLWGEFGLTDERWLYGLTLAMVAGVALAVINLRRARAGRSIAASRDNERGAAAVGVNGIETRLAAFVFAGIFAGMAGAVHVLSLSDLGERTYPAATSLVLFSMAVIGGVGSVGGTLAGVALVQWLGYMFPEYQILLTGVGLLLILMVVPGGLSEAMERARDRFAVWCGRRRGIQLVEDVEPADAGAPPTPPGGAPPVGAPQPGHTPPGGYPPQGGHPQQGGYAPQPGHTPPGGYPPQGGHPQQGGYAPQPAYTPPGGYTPAPHGPGAYRTTSTHEGRPLLTCDGVETSYGSFQVLFGIDTAVGHDEMLALLGTNGAGKSTLLKSLSGLLPPDRGRVVFAGTDITNMPAERVARLGLSLMPGGRGIFPRLTVAENMRLAGWMQRNDRRAARRARDETLALFPVLRERWTQLAGDLSGGEQQQLSLAMALVTRPKLLCIDELSLGLAPSIVGQLVDKVREIHQGGTAIMVVEQSVNVALLLAERAVFLEKGQVRFRGPTTGLLERPDVLRAVFLGDAASSSAPAMILPPAERPSRGLGLECHSLVKRFGGIRAVNAVDLVIPPATILGLIGHNGAGKTTLFDVLTGFLPTDGGRVYLGGRDITRMAPHRRAVVQLGRSFQEARLYPSLTVTETLMTALETHLQNRDPLAAALNLPASTSSERAAQARADELIDLLGLGAYRDRPTGELSTGTRRIVELGCLLAQNPAVVLLDEPSGGVAQREAEALAPLLRRVQVETGCSLVVIEHDMALLSSLCDELVALEQGAVIATGPPAKVLADQRVVSSYLGTDQQVVRRSGSGSPGFGQTTPWRGHSPNPPAAQWP